MSDAFLLRIKAAQRDLIEACGTIRRVEERFDYSKSQVGRWNNLDSPDLMPLDAVRRLEADCGRPFVTAVMAEVTGRRLTDPDEERRAEVCVLTTHAEVMRKSADLAHGMAIAIADMAITPAEATSVDRVVAGLETSLSELRASLATIKARGGVAAGLKVVGGEG